MIFMDLDDETGRALSRLAAKLYYDETRNGDDLRAVGSPDDGLYELVSPAERAREIDVARRVLRAVRMPAEPGKVILTDDEAYALAVVAFATINDPGADRVYRTLFDAGALGR